MVNQHNLPWPFDIRVVNLQDKLGSFFIFYNIGSIESYDTPFDQQSISNTWLFVQGENRQFG